MRTLGIVAVNVLMTGNAWASGGFSCTSQGGSGTIELNAGVTTGMGGPIFSFSGSAAVSDRDVAVDLQKTDFEKDHVAQYWLDKEDLRVLLYRERPADKEHGYVQVEIKTKSVSGDDGSYTGTYQLTVWDTAGASEPKEEKVEGPIACLGE
jgi:hypothetical protein